MTMSHDLLPIHFFVLIKPNPNPNLNLSLMSK